jgi:hypothetical protein
MIGSNSFLYNNSVNKVIYKAVDRYINNLVSIKLANQINIQLYLYADFCIDAEVDTVMKNSVFGKHYDKQK